MPFTLIPLFPNEVTYQKQFFTVIYYVQCLHINFFHLIFVKPLNKHFGVPLYLAKTFNVKITLEWPLNLTTYAIGLFQKKSTPMLENLMGWGVNSFGNPDLRWGSEPKNTSSGVTFDFINVSITSTDKLSKNCFAFSNFIILSNYTPLTTFILSFHP